jgi:hypothetical protein
MIYAVQVAAGVYRDAGLNPLKARQAQRKGRMNRVVTCVVSAWSCEVTCRVCVAGPPRFSAFGVRCACAAGVRCVPARSEQPAVPYLRIVWRGAVRARCTLKRVVLLVLRSLP